METHICCPAEETSKSGVPNSKTGAIERHVLKCCPTFAPAYQTDQKPKLVPLFSFFAAEPSPSHTQCNKIEERMPCLPIPFGQTGMVDPDAKFQGVLQTLVRDLS